MDLSVDKILKISTKNTELIDLHLVSCPQITFMKEIYRRYMDFCGTVVPIQITNIERNIHLDLSSVIMQTGANFIDSISIDMDKQFPLKSVTIYFDNRCELYHIDLLNFLSYLGTNKIIDMTNRSLISIHYKNVCTLDKKIYIEIDFKESFPKEINLYLNLFHLLPNNIQTIDLHGIDTILYNKNYFQYSKKSITVGEYTSTFDIQFKGKITAILVLLKHSDKTDLELSMSLLRGNKKFFTYDPHINKILLSHYNKKEHRKNHYILPFNLSFCGDPLSVKNNDIKFLTMDPNDKLDVIIRNKQGSIGSFKIKIWGLTFETL